MTQWRSSRRCRTVFQFPALPPGVADLHEVVKSAVPTIQLKTDREVAPGFFRNSGAYATGPSSSTLKSRSLQDLTVAARRTLEVKVVRVRQADEQASLDGFDPWNIFRHLRPPFDEER